MNETQLIATLLVIIVYCVILIPMVYCFWRLSRYKRKLLMAKKMLQTNVSEDQVTKDQRELTQQQVRWFSNPMAMKQFVYFFAGDDNKGRTEQQLIRKQEEEIQQLEEEIQQARVMKGGIDDGQMYLAAHRMKDDSYHCL